MIGSIIYMRPANIMRLIISYLFLMAAFVVYFFWHFLELELILVATGFIILISALRLHRRDQKKKLAVVESAETSEEKEIDLDSLGHLSEEDDDEVDRSVLDENLKNKIKSTVHNKKSKQAKDSENFEKIKEIWKEIENKK